MIQKDQISIFLLPAGTLNAGELVINIEMT